MSYYYEQEIFYQYMQTRTPDYVSEHWELVTVVEQADSTSPVFVFRRELKPEVIVS